MLAAVVHFEGAVSPPSDDCPALFTTDPPRIRTFVTNAAAALVAAEDTCGAAAQVVANVFVGLATIGWIAEMPRGGVLPNEHPDWLDNPDGTQKHEVVNKWTFWTFRKNERKRKRPAFFQVG